MGKKQRGKEARQNRRDKSQASQGSQPYIPRDDNDLFDNPMVRAAQAALSEEDRDRYKRLGEEMFRNIDFDNCRVIPEPMMEALACLEQSLKSGLHLSMMESNEQELMKSTYGDEWYKKWGYVAGDLTEIVTLKKN